MNPNKEIIRMLNIKDRMVEQFRKGKIRGETTGFTSIDPHFTWRKGEITVMTGYTQSGKSEFMLQLMLVKSIISNWKWVVFCPENMPEEDFYDGLIHTFIGKSVDKTFTNVMSEKEYLSAFNFIHKHFVLVYPEENFSVEYILELFQFVIDHEGVDGCLIDPFNQLDHSFSDREDLYLSKQLSLITRFTIKNNVKFVITAHPKSVPYDSDGKVPVPDHRHLSGGAMWGNKAHNILSIHRPEYYKNKASTLVDFHSHKIKKQKLVGIPGMVSLDFHRPSNRYLEQNGKSPLSKELMLF